MYGGSGLDSISYVLAMTEIAKVDASAAVIMSVKLISLCWYGKILFRRTK
jgi:alkylation response protein AidB-like acyl-CoA dehydrogenase